MIKQFFALSILVHAYVLYGMYEKPDSAVLPSKEAISVSLGFQVPKTTSEALSGQPEPDTAELEASSLENMVVSELRSKVDSVLTVEEIEPKRESLPKVEKLYSQSVASKVEAKNDVTHKQHVLMDSVDSVRHKIEEERLLLAYLNELQTWISNNQTYPRKAKKKQYDGVSELGFSFDSNGKIEGARVVNSSGFSTLDDAALNALGQTPPPSPPEGLNLVGRRFNLPVVFAMR